MRKFIVKSRISDYSYDIYEDETSSQPMELEHLSSNSAGVIKCYALLNYIVDFNNKQSEFYKKPESDIIDVVESFFVSYYKSQKRNLFNYIGIKPQSEMEIDMLKSLCTDVYNDVDCTRHMIAALKLYRQENLQNNEDLCK